ncbi:uncharacterized protein DEA37_0000814 [Paragonimus westermani]|uniref:PH domain-containing protein n=1 Tax=Paragonimus westermani TaxID=34504 RepID=A0A5J4NQA1_9TREM|nr:uncharacterized protein DEA37_0000814 [Paragonimus westermani]
MDFSPLLKYLFILPHRNTSISTEQKKEMLMCGFLFKSPPSPERKRVGGLFRALGCSGSPSRLFKKRWRARYCVLYKVRSRDRTVIFFEYYKDVQCSKLKGRVDLEHCDCIVDDDRVGKRHNVFSIHSIHNNRKRVYSFSAPSPQTMSDWVRHLVEVTGFIDTSQTTMEHEQTILPASIPRGSDITLGTRRVRPSLNPPALSPFHPTANLGNHGWTSDCPLPADAGRTHSWLEDGYRDPTGPEYVMSGPDDEQDGYYRLPGPAHSYVNLAAQTEDSALEKCPRHLLSSLPQLPSREGVSRPLGDPTPIPKPHPLNRPIQRSPSAPHRPAAVGQRAIGGTETRLPNRQSGDSLYFNLWEARNGDTSDPKADPPPITSSGSNTNLPTLTVKQQLEPHTTLVQPSVMRPNARVFRRIQCVSEYHQVPLAVPTTSAASNYINNPAPVPTRKLAPLPPPRLTPGIRATAATLPPVTSQVPVQSKANAEQNHFIDNDLTLPVRAPGMQSEGDSSVDSVSDSSGSGLDGEPSHVKRHSSISTLNDAPSGTAPLPPTQVHGAAETTGLHTAGEIRPRTCSAQPAETTVSEPARPTVQQLNYIEPCNLELGSPPSNGHKRPALVAARFAPGPIPLSCTLTHTGGLTSSPAVEIPSAYSQSTSDDYKIEYKEIDPIGTNALAIVTKHYLDDDDDQVAAC